jgi:hypothetical protein
MHVGPPDGRIPTELVPWTDSHRSSDNLMERLKASGFFDKAPEIKKLGFSWRCEEGVAS